MRTAARGGSPGRVGAMDRVLTGARPTLEPTDAVALAAELFGVEAQTAYDLGSERDRTFALQDSDGARTAVIKISNAARGSGCAGHGGRRRRCTSPRSIPSWWSRCPGARSPATAVARAQVGDDLTALRASWTAGRVALGPPLLAAAGTHSRRHRDALGRRADRVGCHVGASRPGAARLRPPQGPPGDAVGRAACAPLPLDARRHPRSARTPPGGAHARRVRAARRAGLAARCARRSCTPTSPPTTSSSTTTG